MHTLRRSYHNLTDKDSLPYPILEQALGWVGPTGPACFVIEVVLIQAQIFAHLNALNDTHPRTVVVTAFGHSFPGFKDQH